MMIASATSSMNWLCSGRLMNGLISAACMSVAEARTAPPAIGTSITSGSSLNAANSTTAMIHRDRHHLAMGEVDDAHHAEDDRKPERHQAVDEAGQNAADGDIQVDVERHQRRPQFMSGERQAATICGAICGSLEFPHRYRSFAEARRRVGAADHSR